MHWEREAEYFQAYLESSLTQILSRSTEPSLCYVSIPPSMHMCKVSWMHFGHQTSPAGIKYSQSPVRDKKTLWPSGMELCSEEKAYRIFTSIVGVRNLPGLEFQAQLAEQIPTQTLSPPVPSSPLGLPDQGWSLYLQAMPGPLHTPLSAGQGPILYLCGTSPTPLHLL